jgi:hypothetical protein
MAKHHVGRSSEWHVLADDKGMCFANGLLVYLSVNKRLSCTGSRILVFEIDHRRPNPRSTFWDRLPKRPSLKSNVFTQPQCPRISTAYPSHEW